MKAIKKRYSWLQAQARRALQVHFFRFLLVGAGGFLLSILTLKVLHGNWGIGIFLATLITCEVGLVWNFFFHENWTYNSVDHHYKPLSRKLLEFHMSSWSAVVILTVLETVAVKVFHFEYLISFIVAGGITMFWNFFWTKYYIFKGQTPDVLLKPENTVKDKGNAPSWLQRIRKPISQKDLLWRCVAVAFIGCGASFGVLVVVGSVLEMRFAVAAMASLVAGLMSVGVISCFLFSPEKFKEFIKVHAYTLLAVLLCLFFVAIGSVAMLQGKHISKTAGNAITYDEIAFLPNGYFHQKEGVYYTNPEHPPLVKDIAALPFHALDAKLPAGEFSKDVLFQDYAQYAWGKTFLFESGNNAEQLIFYGRFSVLVANATLLFLLFLSIAKVWNKRSGFIALFLIVSSQFVISHGTVVTVDFMAMAFTLLTLVWFSAWLKRFKEGGRDLWPLVLTALCLAGALVSKFSTVLLLPVVGILAVLYLAVAWKKLPHRRLKFVLKMVGIFALALVCIVIFYTFHVRNMPAADIVTQLNKSYDTSRLPEFGLHWLEAIATHFGILGRAFAEFAHGILMINNRIYNGAGGVYFNGAFYGSEGAGLQYFPLLYLTKLQLAYHFLSVIALVGVVWLGWKNRFRGLLDAIVRNPLPVVIAVYAVVFAGIATLSTLQIGLRHILPAIVAAMVLTAFGLDQLIAHFQKRTKSYLWLKISAALFVIWMIGSVLCSFPYYLSYYNALAGGTNNGYKLAVDSNYDWGQDIKRLAKWQQDNGVEVLYADIFTNPFLPIQYYLGSGAKGFAPHNEPMPPAGSYVAVSAHQYQVNTHKDLPPQQQYDQFDDALVARIGTTIFIYKVPGN